MRQRAVAMAKGRIGLEVAQDGVDVRKRRDADLCGVPRAFAIVFVLALIVLVALLVLLGVSSQSSGGRAADEGDEDETCEAWIRNSLADYTSNGFELVVEEPQVDHEFSYSGINGPRWWGCIKPEWEKCRTGNSQSPIDFDSKVNAATFDRSALRWTAADASSFAKVSSDTVHFECLEGCGAVVNTFGDIPLKQIHFHTQSEHALDGQLSALEMHLVHCDGTCTAGVDNFAVFGILFREQDGGERGTTALDALSALLVGGQEIEGTFTVEWMDMIDIDSGVTYSYSGSLTTPPCTENVSWLVQGSVVPLNALTLMRIGTNREDTNRPVQPLGDDRIVSVFL